MLIRVQSEGGRDEPDDAEGLYSAAVVLDALDLGVDLVDDAVGARVNAVVRVGERDSVGLGDEDDDLGRGRGGG